MKRLLTCVALWLMTFAAYAANFTYHGNLQDGGKPADGKYDLELTLYSAAQGGRIVGGPLMLYAVPVRNGAFSADVDFGPLAVIGAAAWLDVKVRSTGGGNFESLNARSAIAASVAASAPVCPGAWTLYGNAGNTAGMYLGTADMQPLTFEVNAQQVGLITPISGSTPNIAFGGLNSITSGAGNTISGGSQNTINASGQIGTIAGGVNNAVTSNGGFVGGGYGNTAAGTYAAVVGGGTNQASGYGSTVAGGYGNIAGGYYSFAAGNYAKVRSPADIGGTNITGDQGTFVWSDSTATQGAPFASTGSDQFLIRAGSGVGINTTPQNGAVELTVAGSAKVGSGNPNADITLLPYGTNWGFDLSVGGTGSSDVQFNIEKTDGAGYASYFNLDNAGNASIPYGGLTIGTGLNVGTASQVTSYFHGVIGIGNLTSVTGGRLIDTSSGAYLSYGGQWTNASDRNLKTAFASIDPAHILSAVLAMPVTSWRYKIEDDGVHHIGPTAQDFFASFGLGDNDKAIGTVDESGVALAAIQGLNRKLENENAQLRASLQQLTERLDKLEQAQEK